MTDRSESDGGHHSEPLASRLRSARQSRGLTQQAVADTLGISRPLLVAIEKGQRQIRGEELVQLAKLYDRSVGELLRQQPALEAFGAQFRAVLSNTREVSQLGDVIGQMERLGDDYLHIARLSGVELPRRYPPTTDMAGLDAVQVATELASTERNRLGLGDGPLLGLRELLDDEVGLRIFALELPPSVAGAFIYAEPLGGCVAVNRKHPLERQRWTLAHEYGHFLTNRGGGEVTILRKWERVPAHERFADSFAAEFLMPQSGLRRRFLELQRARGGKVTPADLMQLKSVYQVSFEALVLRSEELHLLPRGGGERLLDRGFKPREAEALLGLPRREAYLDLLPLRYRVLAVALYHNGDVTEGELARLLRVDRLNARRTYEEMTTSTDVDDAGSPTTIRIA